MCNEVSRLGSDVRGVTSRTCGGGRAGCFPHGRGERARAGSMFILAGSALPPPHHRVDELLQYTRVAFPGN